MLLNTFRAGFFLLIILCVWGQTNGQENAQFTLSESLLECYNGSGLNHKENLLPMTLSTFLDIIRKVEMSIDGQNMNIGQLATSMLHRFKSDGIQRTPNVVAGSGIIPYSVTGTQSFYNRLLLIWLIPANNYRFPNESLTAVERCTLHFMLSKSIERYYRGDEGTTCNRLSSFTNENEFFRFKRSINISDESQLPAEPQPEENFSDAQESENTESVNTILSTVLNPAIVTTTEQLQVHFSSTAKEHSDVDIDVLNTSISNETKGNMFLDPNEDFRQHISGKYVEDIDHKESENIHEEAVPQGDDQNQLGTRSIISNNEQLSDCPVENGVIYTSSGAVSISSVLAGIVTGLEPQNVNLQFLAPRSTKGKLLTDAVSANADPVDNRWASTLAGDLAEVILYQGPYQRMRVGAQGGWNSTTIPRWYFLNSQEETYITDADIRGGIDGLIIANNIQTWNQRTSQQLRISEVFDMYYSETGLFQTRSCERNSNTGMFIGTNLQQQIASFSAVLDANSITPAVVSFTTLSNYSEAVSRSFTSYVASSLTTPTCSRTRNTNSTINAAVDLIVIIDRQWSFEVANSIIRLLAEQIQVSVYNSNITVLTGQSPTPLINSTNSINSLTMNFTIGNYTLFPTGFNLRSNLETILPNLLRNKMEEDRFTNNAGGRSTAILFIPNQGYGLSDTDLQASIDTYRNTFKLHIPDATFFYAVNNRERFQNLVQDYNRDIFSLSTSGDAGLRTSVQAISSRLLSVPQRIINPYCGSDWESRSYTTAQFSAAIHPGTISYYRLHQNYFYSSSNAKIKVQGSGSGSLRVCSSRQYEFPNNANNSANTDVQCKVINSDFYEIVLNSGCENDLISLCNPLYISVEAIDSEPTTFNCRDRRICHFIGNVQYTISHEGLGCTSAVGRIVLNYYLTGIAFLITYILGSHTTNS